jgi:hypothetical protein
MASEATIEEKIIIREAMRDARKYFWCRRADWRSHEVRALVKEIIRLRVKLAESRCDIDTEAEVARLKGEGHGTASF